MSVPGRAEPRDEGQQLRAMYARRFGSRIEYRDQVWQTLNASFFHRWIDLGSTVLDLGCGYGEFINNVTARARLAMDLNPDAKDRVDDGVTCLIQDCSETWPLEPGSLDVVFTSNFLEHLPSKEHLRRTLAQAHRCLRPDGKLIALGPNVRLVPGAYWDFFDHHIPLSERSLAEAMQEPGFDVEHSVAAFLPYTMSSGRHYPQAFLRAYLRMPLAWRVFGKQFLVVARRA